MAKLPKRNSGPLEAQVESIFRAAWQGSALRAAGTDPNIAQIRAEFINVSDAVERAICLLARFLDQQAM